MFLLSSEGLRGELRQPNLLGNEQEQDVSPEGRGFVSDERMVRLQPVPVKKFLDIPSGRRILKLLKFTTGRPSVMGFVVSTINLILLVESVTRKGRGLVVSLSIPRAFFVYGGLRDGED